MDALGDAQPGVAPGSPPPREGMLAALYGELTRDAWRAPDSEPRADVLFYQRSVAMGWHEDPVQAGADERSRCGQWSMYDAGWVHHSLGSHDGLISWFHAGIR